MSDNNNNIIELEITDLNNLGCGVGHTAEGIVVFVNGTVAGDTVKVAIIKKNKTYLVGKLLEITKRSVDRTEEDFCSAPQSCGGCVYRNITYEKEKSLKEEYVKTVFHKAGFSDIPIFPIVSTDKITHYRNKAQYPVCIQKGKVSAGFFAVKSHNIVVAEDCLLQPVIFSHILKYVCDYATENDLSVYDEKTGRGLLRHVYLRDGKETGEILLCLVMNGDKMPNQENFCNDLCKKFPQIVGVLLNINRRDTNLILGKETLLLYGRDYIEDILCGVRLRISSGSFYQVNHDAAELLYRKAAEVAELKPTDTLLDLYCGTGSIGLSMANKVKEVIGIEIVPEAVNCARENARLNNIKNARFYCGDAIKAENLMHGAEEERSGKLKADVVIIDPPRKGIDKELVDFIVKKEIERVVYVSCNPDTLARDAVYFKDAGYKIKSVTPVDMFPRTGHVETVVMMSRVKE